jgi:hypothetical protein
MARPDVSEATEELYAALAPAFAQIDEATDWTLLRFCAVLTAGNIDQIHSYVIDTDGGPGWQIILDPDRCPVEVLPWLAQAVGARFTPDMDETMQRAAVKDPEVFARGRPAAIVAVAKRRLTGTKSVILTERYTGNAWRIQITTIDSETPFPELTEAEIRAEQKPVGIVLFFNTLAAWDWAELILEEATWADVVKDFGTWFDVRIHVP